MHLLKQDLVHGDTFINTLRTVMGTGAERLKGFKTPLLPMATWPVDRRCQQGSREHRLKGSWKLEDALYLPSSFRLFLIPNTINEG